MGEHVKVYWAPTCSNCMRLKAYIASRGVEFESINVAVDPDAMAHLMTLGVRTFPVVTKGDEFVFGMDLEKVDALLGLSKGTSRIAAEDIPKRLIHLVEAWARFSRQVPPALYNHVVPGLEGVESFPLADGGKFRLSDGRLYVPHGTYFRLIGHVLRHARRVRLILEDPRSPPLSDAGLHVQFGEPLPEEKVEDLIADGDDIIRSIRDWWDRSHGEDLEEPVETFRGPRSKYDMLATEVYSLAQHGRQLMTVLTMNGIEPDGPLTADDYRDLNLPKNVWK